MGLTVGDFTLQRVIGKGGMGQVWAARHLRLGVKAAVKVLLPDGRGDGTSWLGAERPLDAVRNEIRAMARLDHPGIAWIHDFGEVTVEEAVASGGALPPGSPWIAMELASQGSLVSIPRLMGWAELFPFLLALLDALAHAHAHELIHRDLKPGNILICGPGDQRPGIKLTDFGIAQALDEDRASHRKFVGTPHYMAPEQIVGASRRSGPWTDLYSLGCVAWLLTTGKRPYAGIEGSALAQAQLSAPLPVYQPVVNVPAGFERWLKQLLQKHPRDRYRSAADAAWALQQLDEAPEETSLPLELPGLFPSGEPSAGPAYLDWIGEEDEPTEIEDVTEEALVTERVLARHAPAVATAPPTWRRALADRSTRRVGTALFGLRPIPLVGRVSERDTLWNALLEVRRTGRMQIVLVQGASGVGKSRLVEWIARRAVEVGAAEVFRAAFAGDEASGDALQRGWMRMFRTGAMEPELASKLVARTLRDLGADDPALLDGAHEVIRPDGVLDARSRYSLMNLLLAVFCRARPHVLWLDDLQAGLDGVRWLSSLAATQATRPLPVLALATVQDEGLSDRPALAAEIAALDATRITLGPLPAVQQAELVQSLLALDPALSAQVVDRTSGNPFFAVQLVGDWVEAGALVPGENGLRLEGGVESLPASVQALISGRLERVLTGLPGRAGELLEIAAVIGPDVDRAEWRAAGAGPFGPNPTNEALFDAITSRVITARLAEETPRGFTFPHAMVVEALRERARRAGRLSAHAAAAAEMLRSFGGGHPERLGRFLLDAGRPAQAVEPLLEGVKWRQARLGNSAALALLERCAEAAEALSPTDRLRWLVRMERPLLLENLGEIDAALDAVALAEADLSRASLAPAVVAEMRARGALVRAQAARDQGDFAGCEAAALTAIELAGSDGDPTLLAAAWWMATLAAVDSGRTALIRERAELTREALLRQGDDHARAEAHRMLAYVEIEDGRPEVALTEGRRALEIYRRIGQISGAARVLIAIGDALARLGRFDEAERSYVESRELFDVWSPAGTVRPRVALAFLRASRGDWAGAYATVAPIVRDPDPRGERDVITRAWVLMIECCAALGLWSEFDHAVSEARRLVRARIRPEPGDLDSLQRAIAQCRRAGHVARAERVGAVVDAQRAATNSSTNRV